jgi:uncharacterized membrane protein YgdD (TMEM256/DUF423 family)
VTAGARDPSRTFAMRAIVAGSVLMLLAVMLGAFGAHALQERLAPRQLASYHTGVLYQQLHALAIVLLGVIACVTSPSRWIVRAAVLFGVGILLFCGSIYALTFGAPRSFGMVAPVGGVSFMLGWACLALHALRSV